MPMTGCSRQLDITKIPNAANLADEAKISPYHIGAWAYVYTIGYRADLVPGIKFESWNDLWKPESRVSSRHPISIRATSSPLSALLSGGDAAHWEKGQDKLKALKPNFKAFYTNDANSQQLLASGETPVQVVLSMNAYYMIGPGRADYAGDAKGRCGARHRHHRDHEGLEEDRAGLQVHQRRCYDPEVQAQIAKLKKGSPAVLNAKLDPEIAKLPGVFTTAEQWKQQHQHRPKLRAEKTAEWRKWFTENIMN